MNQTHILYHNLFAIDQKLFNKKKEYMINNNTNNIDIKLSYDLNNRKNNINFNPVKYNS